MEVPQAEVVGSARRLERIPGRELEVGHSMKHTTPHLQAFVPLEGSCKALREMVEGMLGLLDSRRTVRPA